MNALMVWWCQESCGHECLDTAGVSRDTEAARVKDVEDENLRTHERYSI